MEEQRISFPQDLCAALSEALAPIGYDRLYILADDTTARLCLPRLDACRAVKSATVITIPSGDDHKTVSTLSQVWESLGRGGASRRSAMINVGGGMVTDLGGFAASTFKRGIRFLNIPTTLLAMVDASAGGKTGINFDGLKNEIGVFRNAEEVLIDTQFLRTLDAENLRSGFAEMLKHAMLSNEADWAELMCFDLDKPDYTLLQQFVRKSVGVKQRIVREDPEEHGLRKALNLGHTVGHALESFSFRMNHPVLHGYAVAWGLVCELYLSCKRTGFPHQAMLQTAQFIKDNYGVMAFDCKQYDTLYELMTHDKKNSCGQINFTLLGGFGDIRINQVADKEAIFDMLDFYRETMGC